MTNTQTYAMMISRLHQLKWGRVRGCDLSQVSKKEVRKNWLAVADFVAHRIKFDVVNWIFLRMRYRWKTTRFPSIMFYLCFKKDFRTLCSNVVNLAIRESVKVKFGITPAFWEGKIWLFSRRLIFIFLSIFSIYLFNLLEFCFLFPFLHRILFPLTSFISQYLKAYKGPFSDKRIQPLFLL